MTLLRKVATLRPADRSLLRQAFLSLLRVRFALWLVPWRRLAASIDSPEIVAPARPGVDRVEWAIRAASHFVPRATCLTRAVALHRLLSKHGYESVVQIGVSKADGRFDAHAWVEHDGRPLLSTSNDVARYSRFFTWPHSRLDLP
jgi:hypothetical protein